MLQEAAEEAAAAGGTDAATARESDSAASLEPPAEPPLLLHALPTGGKDSPPSLELVDLATGRHRSLPLLPSARIVDALRERRVAFSRRGAKEEATGPGAMEVVHVLPVPSAEGMLTVHRLGEVRLWRTAAAELRRKLEEWRRIVGWRDAGGGGAADGLSVQPSGSTDPATMPKHGKADPTGAPHVGGNQWAGGTGGRDTAGLGGKGGPYRLSDGNPIHQISEAEKRNVSPEALAAAKAMAEKAFRERLEAIDMSEFEAEQYQRLLAPVEEQVQQIRALLQSREGRASERVWLPRQSHGELDEARLVDGVAGERNVYKRRAKEPLCTRPRSTQLIRRRLLAAR